MLSAGGFSIFFPEFVDGHQWNRKILSSPGTALVASVLSLPRSAMLVEQVFETIVQELERGESVKLSGFGVFAARSKRSRPGRNPKTGEPIEITARKVV
ncbi:MAG: HU family DNA-binding protein, partial [Magnetococcus sp. YQC-5]